jgi:transaldolase
MNPNLQALHDAGVSIWLDDLSREKIQTGELQSLIDEKSVTGVTTNPTIFAAAFQDLSQYGSELAALKAKGVDVEAAIRDLMSRDVAAACDVFAGIYAGTAGYDGRVSIEVAPTLAMETQATIDQAEQLYSMVGKPNVLIKIPATKKSWTLTCPAWRTLLPPVSTCRRSTRWHPSSSAASTARWTSN